MPRKSRTNTGRDQGQAHASNRGSGKEIARCKELIAKVPEDNRDEAFEWTAKLSADLFRGEEGQAGIAAFRERRDAPWAPQG